MQKFVFTVKDDVCTANGKDVNATRILEVMHKYGTVEDYDAVVSGLKKEYQSVLDNVVAQNEAIKEQNLSADEIAMINAYRTQRAVAVQKYIDDNAVLRGQLDEVKAEIEARKMIINKALDDLNLTLR